MTLFALTKADQILVMLLVDLAVIAACALALGVAARRLGQAVVLGEIVAGLMLGPSLLGLLPGDLPSVLFPIDVRPILSAIAQLALVLFMFGVGFEVDLDSVRRARGHVARTAGAAVVVPTIAAICLAPALLAGHSPPAGHDVTPVHFAAFLAIVLSVTAFPVLARMLAEASYGREEIGTVALLVAAATDLAAWVGLATVIAMVKGGDIGSRLLFLAELVLFFAVLVRLVRPLLGACLRASWCGRHGPAGSALLILVALALSAAATTALGLHPVFGAFALGVACPRDDVPAHTGAPTPIADASRLLATAGLVLVPTYFISTGLNVDVTTVGSEGLLELGVIIVVATASKVGASMWSARRAGMDSRHSLALGLLLNTRGLTELVVLDIGRMAGIIDGRLFTILVLFALITTAATMPLVPAVLGRGARAEAAAVRMGGRASP